jgi:diacylglycerol kinase (ATP)
MTPAALLIKPAVWRNRRRRAVVEQMCANGAVVVESHTIDDIAAEVAALPSSTMLVACGGDGTVHLAVNAVAGTGRPLAIVPLGTGNDVARHFGLRPTSANDVWNAPTTQVDLGHIQCADGTKRYFAGVASCGFDAQVNERANRYRGPQGTAKYLAALVAELRALGTMQTHIRDDHGSRHEHVTLVAVGNTRSYGGGMRVCPTADACDGAFDITLVAPVTRRTLLRVLPRVFTGTHVHHPAVTTSQTSFVEIGGDPFPVYADGERIGHGPARFDVVAGALTLVMPA